MIEALSVVCWSVMAICAVVNTRIQWIRYRYDVEKDAAELGWKRYCQRREEEMRAFEAECERRKALPPKTPMDESLAATIFERS